MMYYFRTAPLGYASDGTPIADPSLHIQPLIKVFNAMNYDAMTLGNHEFNFGNIENQTMIIGELQGDRLDQAFASIDILVLPAHGENFGIVVVEAAMQGTPSIVSDQLGLMDWIIENNTGLVLPLDVDCWAMALSELTREGIPCRWEPDRLSRLAIDSFSIDSVAKQMLEQYMNILLENKRAR